MEYDREFLTGTVGVLILSLLTERAMYAYEIVQEAEARSARTFQLKEGTVYPALHQMERAGLLKATWRESEAGADREDLRRELWTHFEESGTAPEAVQSALRRFGAEAMVTESLRRVYRWDYACLYLAKIAASIIASLTAALLLEVLVNLRVAGQA